MEQAVLFDSALIQKPERKSSWIRQVIAVIAGLIAGLLIPNSVHVGANFLLADELEWGLLWDEHWVLRIAASTVSAGGAGFVAGLVARRNGKLVGAFTVIPASLVWIIFAVYAWQESLPFTNEFLYVSIGNKVAASVIGAILIPVGMWGGLIGEDVGHRYGSHFDSRRWAIFGIKWYHYLWLPFLIHLVIAQGTWAGLYGFEWLKLSWRAGPTAGAFLPTVFVLLIWGTFILIWTGLSRGYAVLAGFETDHSWAMRTGTVIKYGFGLPVLAWTCQAMIMLLHYGLARLFS